jgi:hypothetical protein
MLGCRRLSKLASQRFLFSVWRLAAKMAERAPWISSVRR